MKLLFLFCFVLFFFKLSYSYWLVYLLFRGREKGICKMWMIFLISKIRIYLCEEREREKERVGDFFISVCFYNVLYSFLIFQMELLFCVPKLWGSLWDIVQVYLIISFYINETAKKKYVILIKLLWNNNNVSLLWTDNAFCKYQFPIIIIFSTII